MALAVNPCAVGLRPQRRRRDARIQARLELGVVERLDPLPRELRLRRALQREAHGPDAHADRLADRAVWPLQQPLLANDLPGVPHRQSLRGHAPPCTGARSATTTACASLSGSPPPSRRCSRCRSRRSPSRSACSRCADLGVHDGPIRAFTIARNPQAVGESLGRRAEQRRAARDASKNRNLVTSVPHRELGRGRGTPNQLAVPPRQVARATWRTEECLEKWAERAAASVARCLLWARIVAHPRRILPGETYLITRRCYQRTFRLRRCAETNRILYSLRLRGEDHAGGHPCRV